MVGTESEIRLFADDCVCCRQIDSTEDTSKLQKDIDQLGKRARKWSMRFQPVKCNIMQLDKQTDLILLDFSKAFDKVNHSKLIQLHAYGVRSPTLRWIQAFLSNRQQRVVVDGENSDSVPVTSGITQGSVLRPVLFLAYINDLPQVRLFADDTAIYLTIESQHDSDCLQRDLDLLHA